MDAFVGLGSNVGDRMRNLATALEALAAVPDTDIRAVSHVYESEPAYDHDQDSFFNMVAGVDTELAADVLLDHLMRIEDEMGRVRVREMGPRVIDLDILLYGEEEWDSPDLVIPHPGIAERSFVVVPLLEIAPRTTLPDGAHLRRAKATVGRILRDVGPVVGIERDSRIPVVPAGWVEVARTEDAHENVTGFDADLTFKRTVLEQEGIPYAFDPFEPGTDVDPFGFPIVFRLLVPVDDAEHAAELLADVEAAAPLAQTDVPGDVQAY